MHALRAAGGPRRETEVENLRVPLRRHDDVVGLDVAVDDALGMRVGERVGDLDAEIDRAARVQRAAADERPERLARHVLEREKQLAGVLADFVERCDVRMRERGRRARFAHEALAPRRVVGDSGGQHFDRDGTAEARVARAVHVAHAARADAVQNLVLPELFDHRRAAADDYTDAFT